MSTPLEYRTLYRNAEGFIRLRANSPAQAWPQLGLDVTLMEQGEAGEAGRLLFACRTDPSMSNPLGMVHGGISAALVDTSTGQMSADVFAADSPEEILVTASGIYAIRR